MKKKLYAAAISTAVAASLLTAGNVMAENIITPSITAAQIALGSECGKTGNFTFTFDAGTVLTVGDKFEMALPLSATQAVTLCKGLNLVINDDGGLVIAADGTVSGAVTSVAADPSSPVYATTAQADVGGIAFRITGSATGQVVTLEIIGEPGATLTVDNNDPSDFLSIDFLNELNYDGVGDGKLWEIGDDTDSDLTNTEYNTLANKSANAMCIDVSQWNETVVTISLDANDTKYSYSDTGPRIASIGGGNDYDLRQCGPKDPERVVGTIDIPEETQEGGEVCGIFYNEMGYYPYCDTSMDDEHANNEFVIEAANGWAADNYTIEMTILVNGEAGDHGVYFSSAAANTQAVIYEDACDLTDGTSLQATANSFYLASGKATDDLSGDCDNLEDDEKAVKMVIEDAVIPVANAGDEGLHVPVPGLIFNGVAAGDVVTVKISIGKAPCTFVAEEEWNIGTFVDSCSVAASSETIQFPYFVVPNDGGWWNGLAVTNYSMEGGTLQLTIFEEDGDQGTAEVEIGANSMFVDTLYNMIFTNELFTQTAGEGTLGDSRSYVVVRAEGIDIDGFGMISNSPTGQSMGYLTKDNFHLNHDLFKDVD